MSEQPEYTDIFEYLEENYGMESPDTPITRFYKKEITEIQYQNLDGKVRAGKYDFPDSKTAAEMVTEFAKASGADLVGFTKRKDSFVFKGVAVEQENCVVLGKEMDFELIRTAPDPPSGVEVLRAYWRLGDIACKVAGFIRSLGYPARAHHPRGFMDFSPTILHTAAAVEAGLGEVGRLGLLITEEFGPRIRIATITTDLELPEGKRKHFGVHEFCAGCHVCRDVCRGGAIPEKMIMVRGHLKYAIDPYKCIEYFAKYDGCNLCVSRCVFNKRLADLERFISKINQ